MSNNWNQTQLRLLQMISTIAVRVLTFLSPSQEIAPAFVRLSWQVCHSFIHLHIETSYFKLWKSWCSMPSVVESLQKSWNTDGTNSSGRFHSTTMVNLKTKINLLQAQALSWNNSVLIQHFDSLVMNPFASSTLPQNSSSTNLREVYLFCGPLWDVREEKFRIVRRQLQVHMCSDCMQRDSSAMQLWKNISIDPFSPQAAHKHSSSYR